MSLLILARHGKASAFTPGDYDQLSEPGFEQARLLGTYWGEQKLAVDRVYVGPRKRHQQTYETALAGVRAAGVVWPEPIALPELDEHDGINLVFRVMPELAKHDEQLRPVVEAMARGETPSYADVMIAFKRVTRRWARGEVDHPEVEGWGAFRARVERGLERMTKGAGRGQTIVAFTSAGAVAAAVGHVLRLGNEMVLDLSWSLHNGSLSELAFSPSGWGLRTFNGTPHIRDARLVTSV